MPKITAAVAYADRRGVIGFRAGRAPKGVLVFARHRDVTQLEQIVGVVARHGYDGRTLLVPGVPEAAGDDQALEALELWRDWAFQKYRVVHGAALITDDIDEVAA